jgi:glycosyltransferase involved in cell wall biosynthesis
VTIAFDATPLIQPTGGVARYTWELARAMAAAFPEDQHWLLSDQPFSFPGHPPANLHTGSGPRHPGERFWWLWGLHREMTRRGVDLFHGTDFAVPYLPRRPAVMTLHDLSPWMEPAWQPAAHRVRTRTPRLLQLGLAHMVITPSEAVRRAAIERFQLDPERVAAVPLGASEAFRPVDVPPPAVPYFLFVGTLEPRKNIARMIEAWRAARACVNVELVLAGRLRQDFAPPAPEPGLRLLGAVPDADLPALYSGALAVLYPSLYEGFGLPVLEAMRCAALVIASRDPAILEVTGGEALHVQAHDTAELARLLTDVAQNPAKYNSVREVTRKRAECSTWNTCAVRTREVYAEAARRFSHA